MIYLVGLILLVVLAAVSALLIRGDENAIKLERANDSLAEAATYEIIE
jgi:hypothetical protein